MKDRMREAAAFLLWLAVFAVVCRLFAYGMERQGYEYIAPAAGGSGDEGSGDPLGGESLWDGDTEEEIQEQTERSRKKRQEKKESLRKARAVSFEKALERFPSSYHSALRALHKAHPDWHFEAVQTAVSWDRALANESRTGKNSIEIDPYSHISYVSMEPGAYDQSDDTFTAVDAGGRYTPSREVVAYYMDPRNFLTESEIFQFEDLSYNKYHTQKVVRKMLETTFMNGSYTCVVREKDGTTRPLTKSYAETFMTAGKEAGVNPYHLVSRVIQENGSGGSAAVRGTGGCYNFFNVAAGDSPGGNAVARGLAYAAGTGSYYRPWSDPYRAIVGGAQFLGEEYINEGQDTLYFQKWSVVDGEKLFWHQYMSNVQAPAAESSMMYHAYRDVDCLEEEFVFRIPVYSNMPSAACGLPGARSNPNHYLSSIRVRKDGKDCALTPKFRYDRTSYEVRVPADGKKVTVTGTPVSAYASVRGNGRKALREGTNAVSLICVAQDGTSLTYTVRIIRESGEEPEKNGQKEKPEQKPEQKPEETTEEKIPDTPEPAPESEKEEDAEPEEQTPSAEGTEQGEQQNGTEGEHVEQSDSFRDESPYGAEAEGERSAVYRASDGGGGDRIEDHAERGADGSGAPA